MSREVGMTFSAPMAGAIWRDEKWQTRRTSGIAHLSEEDGRGEIWVDHESLIEHPGYFHVSRGDGTVTELYPRLRVGDVMVVREPWRVDHDLDDTAPRYLAQYSEEWRAANMPIHWEADGPAGLWCGKFRQAMHMPHAFARSRRVVTGVRVERLGDISEADADAEGADTPEVANIIGAAWSKRDCYFKYWEHLHGKGAFERDRRKWAWVYEFARKSA